MQNRDYYIWVEIEANKNRLLNENDFDQVMDKCIQAGIGSIILAVKDTRGFGIYNSTIVPHYSKFDADFKEIDYLQLYIEKAHKKGLKLYAGIDAFAEGRVRERNELAPGFRYPHWQTCLYGIDENQKPHIRPIGNLEGLRTTGAIDDFNEIFVNPVHEEVRNYEKSIVKELVDQYDMDGIVLDRVRFVGIGSDFSDYTKKEFEKYIGHSVDNWPQEIYELVQHNDKLELDFGALFGDWVTFRASVIKNFIVEVEQIVKNSKKKMELIDYTGSWYPIYYLVGANWARNGYIPDEYPWVDNNFGETGYAEHIDKLLSGFYYEDVTIEEARSHNKPQDWYSVEGSGDLVQKVVGNAVPYVGSLFLQQYQGHPEKFREAVEMCFQKSKGCMLFDLCYVEEYNWWELCKMEAQHA